MQLITRQKLELAVRAQRADRLSQCPLFEELDRDDLLELGRRFDEISVAAGEVFIVQDSSDPYVYLLSSGRLEVFRSDRGSEEIVLATVTTGEPVGEMGYFAAGMRSASVRAVEPSHLLRARYAELTECIEKMPRLAKAFWSIVTQRLRSTTERFEHDHRERRSTERYLEHLEEFLDLSEAKALGAGIEGLIENLVHTASNLLSADRASLFLIDPHTGELWSKVAEGSEVKEIRIPPGIGVAGWAAEHNELVNITDAYQDPRFNQEVDRRTGYRTRTIICGPISNLEDETIGVVQVINKEQGLFDAADEKLFRAFAHQAGVAVENFHLYNRMAASHEKMAVLLDIGTALSETLDLATLIRRIVTKMPRVLDCQRASFFVLDTKRHELWSMEAQGTELAEIRFPASVGLAGHAATHAEVVNIDDAYEDDRFNRDFDLKSGFRTQSVLCVPVFDREGLVGGIPDVVEI